jgi:hypothetical protein
MCIQALDCNTMRGEWVGVGVCKKRKKPAAISGSSTQQ